MDLPGLEQRVTAALHVAGAAAPRVRVPVVDTIPAGAAGKRPLVVSRRPDRPRTGPSEQT
jgi:hypothetical protein